MAIDTFTWPTQAGDTPEITYRVRTVQFGSGYRQSIADGPNNKQQSYPVTCIGLKPQVQAIMRFLDDHAGARAFLWTTPLGDVGLFTCKAPTPIPLGNGVFKLVATFEQAFHP
jgi:phage-related protein